MHVACVGGFRNYMLCRSENLAGREDHFSQVNGREQLNSLDIHCTLGWMLLKRLIWLKVLLNAE